ncbi:hypothetical protein [Clostridium tetani]|uniref:Uncharacterized protein n=1 Tax=Clostridium tetani TaxID=1513 RepID=A0ABY0EQ62_CLOTA|nr:hypothetical protein [Clostridium tetani]KHO39523.1 hypothetical protein OR62_05610 [Clostridium tetani]RXI52680.1 hypothetical protein DP131_12250 [Clostridium tetani]RXI68602.1 hypothetical protein DQN76_10115 [Clostridium tetani]CDI49185.1 hypothetical protein BN906_01178 [Clostridium tetani 12124569]
MSYKLEVIKKTNGEKYTFKRLFLSADVDRRIDMGATQATFKISNNAPMKLTNFGGIDGIIDNSNRVNFYWNDEPQFTGTIKNYNIKSSEEIIEVIARDDYSKLLKPIDPGVPYLIYKDIMASDMVLDLCKRAGLKVQIKKDEIQDYKIEKEMKIKYDTQFSDVVEEAITTMESKGIMNKEGILVIGKPYPNYLASDVPNNINYNWYYEDFIKIADADSKRNTDTMYSRLLVKYNEKIYNVYEEPKMKKYLGGENRFTEVETVLADTEIKRRRIANKQFLDMWRRNTNLDIIATKANPKLKLRDVVRTKIKDDYLGHYMVVGIHTSFTPDSVNDQIALEGMRENTSLAVLSTGNYTIEGKKKGSNKNETYEDVKENVLESFNIDKTGKIKLGFADIEKQPYLEVKAFLNSLLETKHYDLVIQDPNKSFYGYKQQILGDSENIITKTGLNSCQSITYSGWSGQPEYFKITKPMPGRWYVYLQSDTSEEYKANISVNMPWKKVKIDEV